jgi:hypothetical protein
MRCSFDNEYFGAPNANEAVQFIRNFMALLGEMADMADTFR